MLEYIKNLQKQNQQLLIFILILMLFFEIWLCIAAKTKSDLKKENAELRQQKAILEQQVVDYKWQLEQVEYIIEYQRGD